MNFILDFGALLSDLLLLFAAGCFFVGDSFNAALPFDYYTILEYLGENATVYGLLAVWLVLYAFASSELFVTSSLEFLPPRGPPLILIE